MGSSLENSKAINSLARGQKREKKRSLKSPMGAVTPVLTLARKRTGGERLDGTLWEKRVSWFGYKLHFMVDDIY